MHSIGGATNHPNGQEAKGPCQMADTAKAQIGHMPSECQEAKGPCQMAKTAKAQIDIGHMPSECNTRSCKKQRRESP